MNVKRDMNKNVGLEERFTSTRQRDNTAEKHAKRRSSSGSSSSSCVTVSEAMLSSLHSCG